MPGKLLDVETAYQFGLEAGLRLRAGEEEEDAPPEQPIPTPRGVSPPGESERMLTFYDQIREREREPAVPRAAAPAPAAPSAQPPVKAAPRPRIYTEWMNDEEFANHCREFGLEYEQPAANTLRRRPEWETSTDSAIRRERARMVEVNRIGTEHLRREVAAAKGARAEQLAGSSVDVRPLPVAGVIDQLRRIGIQDPELEAGFRSSTGTTRLPPPRQPPSWRDGIVAARDQQRLAAQEAPPKPTGSYMEQIAAGVLRRGGGGQS